MKKKTGFDWCVIITGLMMGYFAYHYSLWIYLMFIPFAGIFWFRDYDKESKPYGTNARILNKCYDNDEDGDCFWCVNDKTIICPKKLKK